MKCLHNPIINLTFVVLVRSYGTGKAKVTQNEALPTGSLKMRHLQKTSG